MKNNRTMEIERKEYKIDWDNLTLLVYNCNKNQEYIDNHAFEFNVLDMIVNHVDEINLENVNYESEEE